MPFFPRIIDGGTGTEIERTGVPMNNRVWSAEAILTHPQVLSNVHRSFVEAGADLIIANTFSTALHNLKQAGLERHFETMNRDAVLIAKECAQDAPHACLTAGAISTTTFTGALDYSLLSSGDVAVAEYAHQAEIQAQAGAELIILEMMRDLEHTAYALEGALASGVPVWIGFSCEVNGQGEPVLIDTDIPLEQALHDIHLDKAQAVGIMHTLVEHTPAALDTLAKEWTGTSFAYPHAGRFEKPNWIFQDIISPEDFANLGLGLLAQGVDAVGGCCGISPLHIKKLRESVDSAP